MAGALFTARDHDKLVAAAEPRPPLGMAYACIDIGSNTTRLLVAEQANGQLRELLQQRTFTRIGKGRKREDRIDATKIGEIADVVATQVRVAEELGAGVPRAVATAAIR